MDVTAAGRLVTPCLLTSGGSTGESFLIGGGTVRNADEGVMPASIAISPAAVLRQNFASRELSGYVL